MHTHERKQNIRRTGLKILAVVLAIVLVFSTALFLLSFWERQYGQFPEQQQALDENLIYAGKEYVLRDNIETLLVLGLDTYENDQSESYNNDQQADFLMLLVMDKENKTCKGIHINRDTIVEMNVLGVAGERVGTVTKQIALSHTYGNGREVSCRNTANAVSGLLGITVDHYLSITMSAVPVYNDLVGGVTVEVLDDFTAMDASMAKGETVTLTGEQALLYVRSRQGLDDPTNNQRMKRQKQYLEGLYESSRRCVEQQEGFVSKAALTMADHLVSDCSGNKLESLLTQLAEHNLDAILNITGETVEGTEYMEFYPDEDSVMETVIDCFYELAD